MTGRMLEGMARAGYGARGVVYCLVSGLALLAALGAGGVIGGNSDALQSLLGQPFGWVLLGVIALGLACYAAWRFIESLTDADRRGTSAKALAVRGAHLVSGIASTGLALSAMHLALGHAVRGSGDQSARDWTAWLLSQPFGQVLAALAGLVIIISGLVFVRKGWRGDVTKHLSMTYAVSRWAVPCGRMGYVARGIVFALIGGFLVAAAVHARSSEAKGIGGALQTLQQQPYGWALLALTAAGLMGFGLFGIAQARYRRIDAPDAGGAVRNALHQVKTLRPEAG